MINQTIFALFNAVAFGMAIFLVAAGLTLIFGILKILNMAQGAFFMVGAYITYTLLGRQSSSLPLFVSACIVAGVVVGVLGLAIDRIIFDKLRKVDYHYSLIATFGVMMVCNGLVKLIWGIDLISINPPIVLDEPMKIGTIVVARYTLFLIAAGVVVYAALELAIHRLWLGKLMQALATDSWMTGMLGVNVPLGLLLSVVASFFLAGMAGGLLLPNQSLSPELGDAFFQYAFFAVIIGGLGNIRGAFIASILLGLVDSLNTVFLPHIPRLAMYVALAAFLLWRPTGLFPNVAMGTEGAAQHIVADKPGKWVSRRAWQFIGLVVFACVAAVPFWANEGLLFLIGTALIQGVFALSWNILFGYAGLASFGHAAFFALGAYFMGAILRYYPEIPFLGTLVLSGMMGAVVAWLVGSLALRRLSGVFLAILTVALCEVTRLLISYSALLGKDDGLVNIPRPKFNLIVPVNLSSSAAYFWFLLIAVSLLIGFLWWVVHGRYGRILLSIRQDPARAAFLGISVARVRISAFMLSGGVAAIAGALYAPWARIVTLDEANLLASTQPLLNAMLGGVNSFWGPLLGSAVFTMINFATRTMIGLSEVIVGSILLFIILVAPNGLVGLWRRIEEWLQGGRQTADANAAILPETRSSVEIQSGAH